MKPLSLLAELVPPGLFIRIVAFQYRFFEPELRQLNTFVPPGRTAIDVGTWWGPWSWWLAKRASTVQAFEPNQQIYDRLRSALPDNVTVHNVALSDHNGQATLWSPSRGRGTEGRSSLLGQGHEGWLAQTVSTEQLDKFAFTNVGFVKIDVEGHELAVLRGAAQLIERENPNVLVEVEQAHHVDDDIENVFSFFAERGYDCTFFSRKQWQPLANFDRHEAGRLGESAKSTGLLKATFMPTNHYIHNFLFRPGRNAT
ncbi:MAG TPA: FkbM family methyltransferase [Acidimicrobiales bacterium]|nr:FkbM family methyltransferase [Acidimicrobiales bacterium]